jgi:hypothetical protein
MYDLLIGAIIGIAIGAYLYGAGSRWLSTMLIWRPTLPKKWAEKRANQLIEEQQKITELQKNPSQYVGLLIGEIARAVFYVSLAICSLIIAGIVKGESEVATKVFGSGSVFAFLVALYCLDRVEKYGDLTKYKARVEKQLNRLKGWGP